MCPISSKNYPAYLQNLRLLQKQRLHREEIEKRAVKFANYIIETGATIRGTALRFGISKTTVHNDVTIVLKEKNPVLAQKVRVVLDQNNAQKHIRGGEACRAKYNKNK